MVIASLGVPMVDISGKIARHGDCPEFRTISADDLEKHKWKTIEEAETAGFEGHITYAFGEHPDRKLIARAFEKLHSAPESTDSFTIPDTLEIKDANGKKVTVKAVEILAQFGAILFRNRKKFADRRKKVRAKLYLSKGGLPAIIDRRSSKEVKERFSA